MSAIPYQSPGVISPPSRPPLVSRKTAFIVLITILSVAAITRVVIQQQMKLWFQKLPVPPAFSLITIPPTLGPWLQASVDRAENPDFVHELGTSEYVFRTYIDSRLIPETDRAKFVSAKVDEREKMLQDPKNSIVKTLPVGARMRFALTYYTGSADTVPHVPERCYAADGWKPDNFRVVTLPVLPRTEADKRNVDVRMMNFEDQIQERSFKPTQVCYFFQVNGAYEQDPIFGVRKRLQNLLEPKAYFAKIELVTGMNEAKDSEPVMQDFLSNAMPQIERVLPDWEKEIGATK